MDEPIFSPDGEFMWTGSDWIPTPPINESTKEAFTESKERTLQHNPHESNTNLPRYDHQIESTSVVVGVVTLLIVSYSYSQYQHSICGTFLSPLSGNDCSLWNTFNVVFSFLGILVIVLGLIGKKVAANPIQAILFELQYGRTRFLELEKKIGIDSTKLRFILKQLEEEGKIIEDWERNNIYYELK